MTGISDLQLLKLASDLNPRRQQLIRSVGALRLATGDQLRRLHYPPAPGVSDQANSSRLARLDLASLSSLNCLYRLERRIGGVRAGSAGYVYALGAIGRRLIDLWSGEGSAPPRSRYEPSVGFVDHALAVTECIVQASERIRRQATAGAARRRLDFAVERDAWRNYLGGHGEQLTLKPDAEVTVHDDDFADYWWLEIDRATERRSVIRRKLGVYVDYYRAGHEQRARGVVPIIAWLTTTKPRAAVLAEEIAALPADGQALFRVGLLPEAAELMLGGGQS